MLRLFRPAALLIALSAMLAAAMLPAGWMPSAGGALTLCSLDGPHTIPAPGKQNPADDGHVHAVCPFAAAQHLVTPPVQVALGVPAPARAVSDTALLRDPAAKTAPYAPQSPRAPPTLV